MSFFLVYMICAPGIRRFFVCLFDVEHTRYAMYAAGVQYVFIFFHASDFFM